MRKILCFLWFCLWIGPLLVLGGAFVLAVPMLILTLMGLATSPLAFLLIVPVVLGMVVLGLAALYGYWKGFYLTWVLAQMAFRFALFVLGLSLSLGVFLYPFDVNGMLMLLTSALALWVSSLQLRYMNSLSARNKYKVDAYVSQNKSTLQE